MQRTLVTRSRLVAATLLSLGGIVGGSALAAPAQATCASYTLYVYGNHQGPIVGDREEHCTLPTEFEGRVHTGAEKDTNTPLLPAGAPTGGGAHVWVPLP